MSFGEYETDPARSVVDRAVDGAAAAGVVPVAAAGNSGDLGRGSIGSPATASRAIAVAAVTKSNILAGFSSSGPTALSLRMRPHVSAPGASILSSVPEREGTWASFSGTSMASPHVAGAVALLLQRHPQWTVDQVTSALVQTGRPVTDPENGEEALATREGGGLVDIPAAVDSPRLRVALGRVPRPAPCRHVEACRDRRERCGRRRRIVERLPARPGIIRGREAHRSSVRQRARQVRARGRGPADGH